MASNPRYFTANEAMQELAAWAWQTTGGAITAVNAHVTVTLLARAPQHLSPMDQVKWLKEHCSGVSKPKIDGQTVYATCACGKTGGLGDKCACGRYFL